MISFNKEYNFVDDYVVFDLETTGLDPEECQIIEIGALKYRQNELVAQLDILINPHCEIPSLITNLTGIDNELVNNCPTIDEALPRFLDFIEDLTLIAHNSSFDLAFIEKNLERLNISLIDNKNIDTVALSRKYLRKLSNYKLETLKDYFQLENISHRSIGDCFTTNYVYQYCKNKAKVKN